MWSLQNIKLNIGWLCNSFDTCERRGEILQPQSTEFENYIYCSSGFTCSNNNNIEIIINEINERDQNSS